MVTLHGAGSGLAAAIHPNRYSVNSEAANTCDVKAIAVWSGCRMATAEAVAEFRRTFDWYYCQNPAGYYPSVPQCPSGWLQVAPQPQ